MLRFRHPEGEAYLRVVSPGIRSQAELAANSAFLDHLARARAPVCAPLRGRSGSFVESASEDGLRFLATAVAAVPGAAIEPRRAASATWQAVGRALGALHECAADYTPGPGFAFLHSSDLWQQALERLPADDLAARAEWAELDAALATLEPGGQGLTHGDCNPGNLIFDGAFVRVIDFDEPVLGRFVADLARPLREWRARDPAQDAVADALTKGYREVRSGEADPRSALPWHARAKSLEIYAWALDFERWPSDTLPDGRPREEVLAALREDFGAPL